MFLWHKTPLPINLESLPAGSVELTLFKALFHAQPAGTHLPAQIELLVCLPYDDELWTRLHDKKIPLEKDSSIIRTKVILNHAIITLASKAKELNYIVLASPPADQSSTLHHVDSIRLELSSADQVARQLQQQCQCANAYFAAQQETSTADLSFSVVPAKKESELGSIVARYTQPKSHEQSLQKLLASDHPPSPKQCVHIAIALCDELELLHKLGWMHGAVQLNHVMTVGEALNVRFSRFTQARILGQRFPMSEADATLYTDRKLYTELAQCSRKVVKASGKLDHYGLAMCIALLLLPKANRERLLNRSADETVAFSIAQLQDALITHDDFKGTDRKNIVIKLFDFAAGKIGLAELRDTLITAYKTLDATFQYQPIACEPCVAHAPSHWLFELMRQSLTRLQTEVNANYWEHMNRSGRGLPSGIASLRAHFQERNFESMASYELNDFFNATLVKLEAITPKTLANKLNRRETTNEIYHRHLKIFRVISAYLKGISHIPFVINLDRVDTTEANEAHAQLYHRLVKPMQAGQVIKPNVSHAIYFSDESLRRAILQSQPGCSVIHLTEGLYCVLVRPSSKLIVRDNNDQTAMRVERKIKTLGSGSFGSVATTLKVSSTPKSPTKIVKIQNIAIDEEMVSGDTIDALYAFFKEYYANLHYQLELASGKNCHFGLSLDAEANQIIMVLHLPLEQGCNLQDDLDNKEKDKCTIRLRQAAQLCQQLLFLHRLRLIHCDLKPENVIVGKQVRLIDFGSVSYERTSSTPRSTRAFSSSRSLSEFHLVDTRNDEFGLAIILKLLFCPSERDNEDHYTEFDEQYFGGFLELENHELIPQAIKEDLKQAIKQLADEDVTRQISIQAVLAKVSAILIIFKLPLSNPEACQKLYDNLQQFQQLFLTSDNVRTKAMTALQTIFDDYPEQKDKDVIIDGLLMYLDKDSLITLRQRIARVRDFTLIKSIIKPKLDNCIEIAKQKSSRISTKALERADELVNTHSPAKSAATILLRNQLQTLKQIINESPWDQHPRLNSIHEEIDPQDVNTMELDALQRLFQTVKQRMQSCLARPVSLAATPQKQPSVRRLMEDQLKSFELLEAFMMKIPSLSSSLSK